MPRFFIDFEDGALRLVDDEGQDFDSLQAARDAAIAALPDIGREVPPSDGQRRFMAYVRDEHGTLVCRVSLHMEAECHPVQKA